MASSSKKVLLVLLVFVWGWPGHVLAGGDGTIRGSYSVNNDLPDAAELQVVLLSDDAAEPLDHQKVTVEQEALGFAFTDLPAGSYRLRLVAQTGQLRLDLGECPPAVVSESTLEISGLECDAMGFDGVLSGTVTLKGGFPEGRVVYLRARRSDMTHQGWSADGINSANYDIDRASIAQGVMQFEFEGLSFGIWHLDVMGYDFETHAVDVYGEYPGQLVVDASHLHLEALDFAADLPPGTGD